MMYEPKQGRNKEWICRRCGKGITGIRDFPQRCQCHPSKVQPIEVMVKDD